jgi:8-oxo-dGTP diphosphatase
VRRRPDGGHLPGVWEFPGGKRRPGERAAACAERETREETGLEVRAGREALRIRHAYPDRTVRLRFFPCALLGGRLPRRGPRAKWVTPAALLSLPTPAANAPVVAALAAGGFGWTP